jgi:hypothetical protein
VRGLEDFKYTKPVERSIKAALMRSPSIGVRSCGAHSRVHCRKRSAVEGKGLRMDCVGGMKNRTVESGLARALKTHRPTSFEFRHLMEHRLTVLPSKVRLKAVGRTGASGNSRRALSDVASRTRHLQTNEPPLAIARAGVEVRVRAIRRLSTMSRGCVQTAHE